MTIGRLAKAAGVGVETIRFYERKGLLEQPEKSGSGFRYYSNDSISQIRFVKRAQELGFTLREVRELFVIQSNKKMTGAQVQSTVEEKIFEVRRNIADLKQMEKSLRGLAELCGKGHQAIRECRFVECFSKSCTFEGKR